MSLSRKLNLIVNDANGNLDFGKEVTVTADGAEDRSVAVAETTNDVAVALAIDVSQLKMLVIKSDQAVTLETNSSSAPDHTFTIAADKPLIWYENCGLDNPFGVTDVTAIWLSNAGATAATVEIRVLIDATP